VNAGRHNPASVLELAELKSSAAALAQKMEHHRERADTLRAMGDEQERVSAQFEYHKQAVAHKAQAQDLALQIIRLNKRIDDLEAAEIRIPAVFVTAEQMAAVDDVADFAAGVAV
jgi:uncharacterized protein involved in type VI secretion and phage assembly